MSAGSDPEHQRTITLADVSGQFGGEWHVYCGGVKLSKCQRLFAATFRGHHLCSRRLPEPKDSPHCSEANFPQSCSGLIIYKASGSFDEQARFWSTHAHAPHISWAAAAPELRVAWPGAEACNVPSFGQSHRHIPAAAFVLDGLSGDILSALGPVNGALLQGMLRGPPLDEPGYTEWSRTWPQLLVIEQKLQDADGCCQGMLKMFDVGCDQLLAQCDYKMVQQVDEKLAACWHPAVEGLVLSSGTQVQNLSCHDGFTLVTGMLQHDYILQKDDGMGFAPNGRHLAACSASCLPFCDERFDSLEGIDTRFVHEDGYGSVLTLTGIFTCQSDGQAIACVLEIVLDGQGWSWLPYSYKTADEPHR